MPWFPVWYPFLVSAQGDRGQVEQISCSGGTDNRFWVVKATEIYGVNYQRGGFWKEAGERERKSSWASPRDPENGVEIPEDMGMVGMVNPAQGERRPLSEQLKY